MQPEVQSVKNMKEAKLQFIKAVHQAIVNKFTSYGVVLTLLASVTFVTILQPPGSFHDKGNMGYMRSPILVGCSMFFSTLSFLLACTGLLAVMAGTASMFRPGFFLNSDLKFPDFLTEYESKSVSERDQNGKSTSKNDAELDDPKELAGLVLGNLHRAWRLRVYLVLSLSSCVVAFVCGAFAVTDWVEKRNGCLLVGAMAVGGVAMVVEVLKSKTGLASHYSGRWRDTFRQLPMLPERHPHSECVSRILRKFGNSPRPESSPEILGNPGNMASSERPRPPSKLQQMSTG